MVKNATITLAYHGLEFRSPDSKVTEDRPLTAPDRELLADWAKRYKVLARKSDDSASLLALGQQMFDWPNGPTQILKRWTDTAPIPLPVVFATAREDREAARSFLDAPWELLADAGQHWSLREDTLLCPVRRIGGAAERRRLRPIA
jgi:hypothetical protein